jgi:CRP-like cAMP-binding protein
MPSSRNPTVPVEELRGIYLLSALSDDQLDAVTRSMRVMQLAEGERLFDFGQPAHHFFYLRSGQIKLFRISAEGEEKVIELIRPGQTFAEAVMFMERMEGYPVSAEAIAPSEVVAFEQRAMMDQLRQSVDTCFRLMATMSWRLRQQINEIDELTLHNATFRLVSYLLQQVPEGVVESPEVQLTTPKNIIASRLSIKPETFSRIMARLNRQGLLDVHSNNIILRDIEGLRALISI